MPDRIRGNIGCFYYSCSVNGLILMLGIYTLFFIQHQAFEASLVKTIGNTGILKNLPYSTQNCQIPLAVTEANLVDFSIAQNSEEPDLTSIKKLKTSGGIICIDESTKTEAKLVHSNNKVIKVLVLTTQLEGQEFYTLQNCLKKQ